MDKSTILGLVGGFALVIGAIVTQGDIGIFISFSAILIVGGGVVSSSVVNYSIEEVKSTFSLTLEYLKSRQCDLRTDIELMNMFARKARREGLLRLEEDVQHVDNNYLKNGMQLAIDGTDKNVLVTILDDQLESSRRNLNKSVSILYGMAEYSPAFGMIGTVIGLILMLQNIQDPEALGAGLAVALLTTLYGTIFANMIFTPLAGKLDYLGDKQLIRNEMFKSAIISIVDEENPRLMENKMLNYVSPSQRAEYRAYFDEQSFNKQREEKLYEHWINVQNNSWQDLQTVLETG
ncbi:MAG: MotA/TolQ/ExbB proton channel family protein [Balneolaceae bacterium]|nr:MotA/TolQ/ExbB proton channel family protein [Balneolaceae bacterium]